MKDDSQVYQNLERLAGYNPKCTSHRVKKKRVSYANTCTHGSVCMCV